MNKRGQRYLPGAILLAGALLLSSTRSQRAIPLVGPLTTVLPELAPYRIENQTISDEEKKVAGMTDYVARIYWRDTTWAFSTYVGYYDRQSQGHTMHSPKNCLPGAGWEVLRADTGVVSAGGTSHVVNRYMLKNGATQALVFYWYQGRGRVVANEYAVKWNLLRDAALEGHTEEALVRIVIPIIHADRLEGAAFDRAVADADQLGRSVGSRLLTDVARVVPSRA